MYDGAYPSGLRGLTLDQVFLSSNLSAPAERFVYLCANAGINIPMGYSIMAIAEVFDASSLSSILSAPAKKGLQWKHQQHYERLLEN